MIAEDIADIESIRIGIAKEIGANPQDKATQAGVEAYAKARIEDLRFVLAPYEKSGSYLKIRDALNARIYAIGKAYGVR